VCLLRDNFWLCEVVSALAVHELHEGARVPAFTAVLSSTSWRDLLPVACMCAQIMTAILPLVVWREIAAYSYMAVRM
jgi:hypothetical protein